MVERFTTVGIVSSRNTNNFNINLLTFCLTTSQQEYKEAVRAKDAALKGATQQKHSMAKVLEDQQSLISSMQSRLKKVHFDQFNKLKSLLVARNLRYVLY